MKKTLQLFFIAIVTVLSCTPEKTTFQVVRHSSMSFNYDSSSTWKAKTYDISPPTQAVVYPADPLIPGTLYNRYTLQAFGVDDKNRNLQIVMVFDTKEQKVFTGEYKTAYTGDKGLKEVQVYDMDNASLAFYQMYDNAFSTLKITKQSTSERLIAGTFQIMLRDARDTTRKMTITSGTLTDVSY
ncbi:hypothetical protein EXU57_00245 [Segetibacter sp. 3557_3]|uniref:hypothetical protein n=1 Tax=Segetibacter sp. 3557_3 TaxID=2547429 RepID=UPI0010587784|nr:hypothetical protein [Segetibacter sp. 3557_3]TDH28544.1 hypothetical protein EXU57_00245 [Segetibacter sp. 3557_3]